MVSRLKEINKSQFSPKWHEVIIFILKLEGLHLENACLKRQWLVDYYDQDWKYIKFRFTHGTVRRLWASFESQCYRSCQLLVVWLDRFLWIFQKIRPALLCGQQYIWRQVTILLVSDPLIYNIYCWIYDESDGFSFTFEPHHIHWRQFIIFRLYYSPVLFHGLNYLTRTMESMLNYQGDII